jgi:hypothetical protein
MIRFIASSLSRSDLNLVIGSVEIWRRRARTAGQELDITSRLDKVLLDSLSEPVQGCHCDC